MSSHLVKLEDYSLEWAKIYNAEKQNILGAVGHLIESIEHIGSTSIHGLCAKPIIDIMVGISYLEKFDSLIPPLSQVDYEYVPKPEFIYRQFFRKGLPGQGTAHLHICEINGNEWVDKLLFRDYLRSHPTVAHEYG